MWATCNVGASSPGDYGDYFAWGETATKSSYIDGKSKTYGKPISDISGKPQYDAATANWGSSWRIPTKVEFQELVDNCTWTWSTQSGKVGFIITSKKNDNKIFLPAAGFRNVANLIGAGERCVYWISTHHEIYVNYVYRLDYSSEMQDLGPLGPCFGLTVRPVFNQ